MNGLFNTIFFLFGPVIIWNRCAQIFVCSLKLYNIYKGIRVYKFKSIFDQTWNYFKVSIANLLEYHAPSINHKHVRSTSVRSLSFVHYNNGEGNAMHRTAAFNIARRGSTIYRLDRGQRLTHEKNWIAAIQRYDARPSGDSDTTALMACGAAL